MIVRGAEQAALSSIITVAETIVGCFSPRFGRRAMDDRLSA
jgi:hypothetical protein